MSIIGKLRIDGQEFNLLSYRLHFHQQQDIAGKPRGRVNGGLIQLQIEAHRDHLFHHWTVQPEQMRDIEIVFSPVTCVSTSRVLQCYDVFCVRINLHFDNYTSRPMTYTILLSPGIIKDGSVVYKKPWHVTDIDAQEAEPTAAPEQEPKILEVFMSDVNNKRIENTAIGSQVYLNIRTNFMVGEKVSIDLDNPDVDYLYDDQKLENDTLEEYIIESDHDRLLIEVIAQESTIESD